MRTHHTRTQLIPALAASALFFATCSSGKEVPTVVIAPAKYIPQAENNQSLKGKAEFERRNCAGCHSIGGSGGCLAPPLDGIGARRSKGFILARITNEPGAVKEFEKLYPHAELLTHPRLSAQSAKLIASYLMTLPEPQGGFTVNKHTTKTDAYQESHKQHPLISTSETIAKGKTLFYERGCISCHALGQIGGHFAPRLDGISKRRDRTYIEDRISTTEFLTQKVPDEYQERGTVMPPTNLSEEQIQQVATFLLSLPEEK